MAKIVLGIDVSKKTLDAALIFDNWTLCKQFKNSLTGFDLLAVWLASFQIKQVHACLEATGVYGEAVALFLHERGDRVSVVNPLRIKGYANANMQRNKTDRLDARLIASFCQTQKPDAWQPPSEEVKQLQSLVRRVEVLAEMLQAEENRLANAASEIKPSIERIIGLLTEEIKELERQIKRHVDQHPNLKEQNQLLQTIPGIGRRTANLLLSEIEARALQFGAFAGGASRRYAEKETIGNQFEANKFVETRQRANQTSIIFSGDSGKATQ